MSRWVKISIDIIYDWAWSHKPEYLSFAIHCIGMANPRPNKWQNIDIPRGSFITNRFNMCKRVGITEQQYRTIIKNLEKCGFLTTKTTNKFTMITICNYERYQGSEMTNQPTNQPTNNQQITNKYTSNNQPTTNKYTSNNQQTTTTLEYIDKEIKEDKNKDSFFEKNGEAENEKKCFSIEELKEILAKENIIMTEQGYKVFKRLNEGDKRYGYKGGVIQAATCFLKREENRKIYLPKNTPPAPPRQPVIHEAAITPEQQNAAMVIWDKVLTMLKDNMNTQIFKAWMLPIRPLKVAEQQITLQCPKESFAKDFDNNYSALTMAALNQLNINKIEYRFPPKQLKQ